MTAEERRAQMDARNAAICEFYKAGATLAQTCEKFGLKRQRVEQILKAGEVWRQPERLKRTKFLGVSVQEETKAKLQEMANKAGTSVSKLASDKLDELVGVGEAKV